MWAEDDVLDAEAEATVANMRWFGSVRDPDRRLSSSVEKTAAQEATGAKFAHLHAGASRFDPPARRASRELLAKPLSPRSPGAAREHVYDLSLTGMASLGRREDPTIVLMNSNQAQEATGGLRAKIRGLCNNYDRALLVLADKLQRLDTTASAHKRRASHEAFRAQLARLVRDAHKLDALLVATVAVLEAEGRNPPAAAFDDADMTAVQEEADFSIAIKTLKRWFAPCGKLEARFASIASSMRAASNQGLDVGQLELGETGFDKIDELLTRLTERVDIASASLHRPDIRSLAKAAQAAVRFRRLSPTLKKARSPNGSPKSPQSPHAFAFGTAASSKGAATGRK